MAASAIGFVAVLAALLLVFVDSGALERQVQENGLAKLSERLGRKVTVGDMNVDWWPQPSVHLRAVRIEGDGAFLFLTAGEASVRVSWWRLIRSRGKEVRVNEVLLNDVDVRLVRRADGVWEIEDLIRRLSTDGGVDASTSDSPAVDRLSLRNGSVHVVDEAKGHAKRLVATDIELTASHFGVGQKMEMNLEAAVGSEVRNVEAQLEIDPMPRSLSNVGESNASEISAQVNLHAFPMSALDGYLPDGFNQVLANGLVDLTAQISTQDEKWISTAKSTMQGQVQGEPIAFSLAIDARMPKGQAARVVVKASDVQVQGPGVDVKGTASFDAMTRTLSFVATGALLDLDTLFGARHLSQPPSARAHSGFLSPKQRQLLKSLKAEGRFRLEQLIVHGVSVSEVEGYAVMGDGVVRFGEAHGKLYSGVIDVKDTTADLTGEKPRLHLNGKVKAVELSQTSESTGLLSASANLTGDGSGWSDLSRTLSGEADVVLKDVRLSGQSLTAQLHHELIGRLDHLGLPLPVAPSSPDADTDGTALGDLSASLTIKDGWMTLKSPISFATPLGEMRLRGRIGIDRRLALTGTVMLTPSIVSQLSSGKMTPRRPVALPFEVGGTMGSAEVTRIDVEGIVKALAAEQVLPGVEERIRNELGQTPLKKLPNLFGF